LRNLVRERLIDVCSDFSDAVKAMQDDERRAVPSLQYR